MFTKLTVYAAYATLELEDIPIDVLGLSEAAAEMTSRGLGDAELVWWSLRNDGTFIAKYDLRPYPGYDNPALREAYGVYNEDDNYDGIGTRDWWEQG